MQVDIRSVKIQERIRKDMGDLSSLVESLKKHGLMEPIVVDKNMTLIAGHRRLESARLLGWSTINAIVLDKTSNIDRLTLEIEENIQRKEFSNEEITEAYLKLDRLLNPGFFCKIWRAIVRFFKRLFRRK